MIKEVKNEDGDNEALNEELQKMFDNDPNVTFYFKSEKQMIMFMIMINNRMQDFFQIPFYFDNVENEKEVVEKILEGSKKKGSFKR